MAIERWIPFSQLDKAVKAEVTRAFFFFYCLSRKISTKTQKYLGPVALVGLMKFLFCRVPSCMDGVAMSGQLSSEGFSTKNTAL